MSRLILSIRSLASRLEVDPDTLLSTAELSRLQWKRGAYDGEIIVEIDTVEEDQYDTDDMAHNGRSITPGFYTTEVGVYDDIPLPIPGTFERTRTLNPLTIGNMGAFRSGTWVL